MTSDRQDQQGQKRIPFHVEFSEKIIKMLEEGTAPWQQPWQPMQNMAPRNPLSGTVYKGGNRVWLSLVEWAEGYDDPRWMTLKQANDAGYRVKKGEHSTTVMYWQFTREQDRLDDAGNPILGADGKPERETVILERPIVRAARVFNAKQIENFPPLPEIERKFEWEPHEKAEAILDNSGAVIKNDQRDRAYYTIVDDEIHLPPKEAFDQAGKYYATALHELGHWTRHPTRLNRENGPYGSAAYAKEELRAEISSWMVGQDIGIGHDPGQHAAYVQSWIEALREDPLEILRACRDAEKIRDYVLGLEHQKEKELPLEKRMEVFIREALLHMEHKVALADIVQEARQALESGSPEVMQDAFTNVFQAVKSGHFTGPRQLVSRGEEILKELNTRSMAEEQNRSLPHEPAPAKEKTWLNVPYREKEAAKALGARWDKQEKRWFAPEGTDLAPLRRFMSPQPHDRSTGTMLNPREEFAAKLADLGLDLKGSLPELDGKMHRVPLLGKNGRGQDGAYCLHGDGIPAGWAQNFVSGEKVKLVATGVVLSSEERERQQRERSARLQARAEERARQYDAAAKRCGELWAAFNEVGSASHPYLQNKGVESFGLKLDPIQGNLIIPLKNVEDELRGFQGISPEGQKAFASGVQKRGNFHLIGGIGQELAKSEILICEGYATGASLHMASGKPVVVAFDSGNLAPVAEALRAKYPQAALTICADNDHAVMLDGKPYNVGHEKAKLAAEKVAAKVLLPKLTAKEKAQGLTDFNDLHKSRGLAEVKKQLGIRERAKGKGRGQEVSA